VIMRKPFSRFTTMVLTAFVFVGAHSRPAAAQDGQQEQQGQQKTTYTLPEYNAFQAANAEKDPQTRIKLLDDFVAKYPNSTLLQYVYALYYQTYNQLKDYAKTIEYADKLVAMGDKVGADVRLGALQTRVQVFQATFKPGPGVQDQLMKQRDAALEGAHLLDAFPKPPNASMSDEDFKKQKMPGLAFFYSAAGFADLQLKDNAAAVEAFKNALANKPDDPVSAYRLGLAYLQMTPPQSLDGFWALARAIDLKVPDPDKIKDYLQKQILAYEQPGCDSQATDQLNELLQLAQNSPDRPSTWRLPSQADLHQISQSSNILSVISDLSGGGDKAKMTWLAICGAEFPEVVGKIIDVKNNGTNVDFMVYTGASAEEMQNATTPNMDVKVWTSAPPPAGSAPATGGGATQVPPQPDVVRLQKDDGIRFSGTLVSYDPSPFTLHWDQVKVDPSIIPEKGSTGKHKVPPKKSSQQ
jgi:tetratricopeptide (TPR) repeat protein